MTKQKKPFNHLHISCRQWFDKVNGNTYFSAYALADGKMVASIPFQYGYGSYYKDAIFNAMKEAGHAPGSDSAQGPFSYCLQIGAIFTDECTPVARRKDL